MPRLQADADKTVWVAVTDSLGFGGRRHRKAAIRMLLSQANRAIGVEERPGGGFMAWAMSTRAAGIDTARFITRGLTTYDSIWM